MNVGKHLGMARVQCGLTQQELAAMTAIHQTALSQMERGKRVPTLNQLLVLGRVLGTSLQWFLTGTNRPPTELPDLALQLGQLGISDLHVENISVPGAFRHPEELMVLAVMGNTPSARIVEAIPAALAWNSWNPRLLSTFADIHDDPRVRYRLAWLADIAITIHQNQGFPGGCPASTLLESYIRSVELPADEDSLGYSGETEKCPPVSLRWKMRYPAPLASFRERAERLDVLRAEKLFLQMTMP